MERLGKLFLTLALLVTLTSANGAKAKDHMTDEEMSAIEEFAGEIWDCVELPGLAYGVVRGEATFASAIGLADWDGHSASASTLYNLGSTAKAFVPYILAEIMNSRGNEYGRLRWNMTLKQLLLSELDLEVDTLWAQQTLRQALIYSASSTPTTDQLQSSSSAVDLSTMAGLPQQTTREEIVRRMVQFMPDTPEFRSTGHYSNLVYTLAGYLAEKVSGMAWEQLIKAKLFNKNGMSDSLFGQPGMEHSDIAKPMYYFTDSFVVQNETLFDLHPFEPVGSIMASADGVTRWLRYLLHNLYMKGNNSGVNMLIGDAFVHGVTPPDQRRAGNSKLDLSHVSERTLGYGMGWEVSEYKGRRRYEYTGHFYAYTSHIWLFPDTRTAVFLVANGHGPPKSTETKEEQQEAIFIYSLALTSILYKIADVAHREKAWVNFTDVCTMTGWESDAGYDPEYDGDILNDGVQPFSMMHVDYPHPKEAYTGTYGNGLVGDLVIAPDEVGVLTLKLGRNLKGQLRPKEGFPTKLMLKAVGSLQETDQWIEDKTLEFLPMSGDQFTVARLRISDKLYYDFERGKMFDTMLVEAEEEAERKKQEEEDRRIREEEERRMREEAARKAREDEERRRREEAEKKAMREAVARQKAEEERRAKEEAERRETEEKQAMLEAVAREKAERERLKNEEEMRKSKSQAAALERKQDGDVTEMNGNNRVDNLKDHQSHQPYSESETGAEVKELPPEKATQIGPSNRDDQSKSASVSDKDGVGSGPVSAPGLLMMAIAVLVLHRIAQIN